MKRIIIFVFCVCFTSCFLGDNCRAESGKEYFVEVSITKCRLWLYEISNGERLLVKEYIVSTVKPSIKKYALGTGTVTKIEKNPVWYPTQLTRSEFLKKNIALPTSVPPGHPLNYMGATKISLSHSVPGKGSVYRIHGVRKSDEKLLGSRVSGGCIRMLNEDGLELAKIMSVGSKVNITL